MTRLIRHTRRGAIAPMTALLLIPLLAMLAFAIDIGYIATTKTQQQEAADAAAVAAATKLYTNFDASYQTESNKWAAEFAQIHSAGGDRVYLNTTTDVEFGFWDPIGRKFNGPSIANLNIRLNAVKVRLHRDSANQGGSLKLYFGGLLGKSAVDVSAEAVAYVPNPVVSTISGGGVGTRFLIDDEMFDTDEPAIQQLAQKLGKTTDWLLTAKDEKSAHMPNWFLNIPAGTVLELPTGQVGDEALLDIDANKNNPKLPQYPFSSQADHSKFLKYNETSNSDTVSQMRHGYFQNSQIDPVRGVGRFNQPSLYPALVNPNFIHVSPVWQSDVSALDGVQSADATKGPDLNGDGKADGYTTNQTVQNGVNGLGYRRGLVAFKITGYKLDPARPYPYLPKLIIEIVDPNTIDLDTVSPGGGITVYSAGGAKNVRLVR